jgi:hypothetical protein
MKTKKFNKKLTFGEEKGNRREVYNRNSSLTGFLLIAVALACLLSANAHDKVVWSCDAMAAVPAIPAIKNELYEVRAGRVIFKDGRSGTVNLFCPITRDLGPSIRSLFLTYRDGDGHEGPSVVSAALRRVNRKTGHVTTFNFGNTSSNDDGKPQINENPAPNSGIKGWATHQSARPGRTLLNQNHQMDLMNFYYYVQITMKRKNGITPLAVMGVFILE